MLCVRILPPSRASWYFGRYVMARGANGCRAPHVRHPRPPMGRGRGPVPVGTHPSKEVCQSTNYSSQTTRSRPPPSSPPPPPRSTRRHLGRRARNCCHHSRPAPHPPHVCPGASAGSTPWHATKWRPCALTGERPPSRHPISRASFPPTASPPADTRTARSWHVHRDHPDTRAGTAHVRGPPGMRWRR
mgnify:CR=1 FL=1